MISRRVMGTFQRVQYAIFVLMLFVGILLDQGFAHDCDYELYSKEQIQKARIQHRLFQLNDSEVIAFLKNRDRYHMYMEARRERQHQAQRLASDPGDVRIFQGLLSQGALVMPTASEVAVIHEVASIIDQQELLMNTIYLREQAQIWKQYPKALFVDQLRIVRQFATVQEKSELTVLTDKARSVMMLNDRFKEWLVAAFPCASGSLEFCQEQQFNKIRNSIKDLGVPGCCQTNCTDCIYNYPLRHKNKLK